MLWLPLVLWRCWLGGRKGIRPVKNRVVGCWCGLSVWSKVNTCMWPSWCHCHSLSLASVKSRLVLPFWYWPTRVVPEKRQLNGYDDDDGLGLWLILYTDGKPYAASQTHCSELGCRPLEVAKIGGCISYRHLVLQCIWLGIRSTTTTVTVCQIFKDFCVPKIIKIDGFWLNYYEQIVL